jgi:hypothetical protein
VLLSGKFKFKMVLEAATSEELEVYKKSLDWALERAKNGRVPIGGSCWRNGCGWLKWDVSEPIHYVAGKVPEGGAAQ